MSHGAPPLPYSAPTVPPRRRVHSAVLPNVHGGGRCVLDDGIEELGLVLGEGPDSPLEVGPLLDALDAAICKVGVVFGSVMKLGVKNDEGNIEKVRASQRGAGAAGGTVDELLRHEIRLGLHTRGAHAQGKSAVLKDPSAAMGLTWLCRSLEFTSGIAEHLVEADPARRSTADAIRAAYGRTVEAYHGSVMRGLFRPGPSRAPPYDELCRRLAPDVSKVDRDGLVHTQLRAYVRACKPVATAIKAALRAAELEDTRKTW